MTELIRLLQCSRNTVVFTGAGVSTLSGIPDFRGKDGLYQQVDAARMFDLAGFLSDPSYYYRQAKDFIYGLGSRQPSLVHTECARLERQGLVQAIITQNIDMLHQKAGSRVVIEVHGSPRVHICLQCGRVYDFAWAVDLVQRDQVPCCESCSGVIKPQITFFGEMLPEAAFAAAVAAAGEAELILVLGSSLVVHPAASLPLLTLQRGGKLVIVNADPTPLDGQAECRYPDLQGCFEQIAAEI